MIVKRSFWALITILLLTTTQMQAQVTIGSTEKPVSGTLLDLKENSAIGANSTRGLLMPRVALEKKKELNPIINTASSTDEKRKYTGLLLFNTSTILAEGLCIGLYVWNAEEWVRLHGKCEEDISSDLVVPTTPIEVDADGFDSLNRAITQFSYTSSNPVTVTSSEPWIAITHNSTTQSVNVDVVPTNGAQREGRVELKDAIGDPKHVTIKQNGLEWSLIKPASQAAAGGATTTATITHTSSRRSLNTINQPILSWITVGGATTKNVGIVVQANTTTSNRTANFKTTLAQLSDSYGKADIGSELSEAFSITQLGIVPPTSDLVVPTTPIEVDADGFDNLNRAITQFSYTSSNPVTVTTSYSWITLIHNSSTRVVNIDVVPTNGTLREGTVELRDGIGSPKYVTVKQSGLTFTISANPATIAAAGGNSTILVNKGNSRRSLTYTTSNSSWASIADPFLQNNIGVTVSTNTETISRDAIITSMLGQLATSYSKTNTGTSISKSTIISQQAGSKPVPTTGRWSYKDSSTNGETVYTDVFGHQVYVKDSPFKNVEIRLEATTLPSDLPVAFDRSDSNSLVVSNGAQALGMQIVKGPTGDYVTFSSISGPKGSTVTIMLRGPAPKRQPFYFAYIFN